MNNIRDSIVVLIVICCYIAGWQYGVISALLFSCIYMFNMISNAAIEISRYKQAYEDASKEINQLRGC